MSGQNASTMNSSLKNNMDHELNFDDELNPRSKEKELTLDEPVSTTLVQHGL